MNLLKYIILILLLTFGYAQKYDPKTGKLIQEKEYDPKTGELINNVEYDPKTGEVVRKEKNINELLVGKEVVAILTSGEKIRGKLVDIKNDQLSISSSTLGSINLQKKNVKSIALYDSDIVLDNSAKNIFDDSRKLNESNNEKVSYSEIINRAKYEASSNNEPVGDFSLGAAGCLFGAIGVPIVLIVANSDAGIKKPTSSYYINLDDDTKKTYRTAYTNEAKKLRRKNITGTMLGCLGVFVFISLFGFF